MSLPKMSIKVRSIVFATFLTNFLIVGLLLGSLTTNHWIHSTAYIHNSTRSHGFINFGLFSGVKDLNAGFGTRHDKYDVLSVIKNEPDVMNYWLWLGAALGTGFGLLASAIAAVASVIKAASPNKKRGTMILLFISNIASAIAQMLAFICWLVQFLEYLTHNVLIAEDRNSHWYSKNMTELGHSFYLVGVGIIVACINIILLLVAVRMERKSRRRIREPPIDEKTQGAIMLY